MDAASVEINDAVFCAQHLQEVCEECEADFREENDAFYGFDSCDRDPISVPETSQNADGVYQCTKHESATDRYPTHSVQPMLFVEEDDYEGYA
ncbi:hypothetical protein NM208_g70 [Fusarium decemcellulare]|uniref:Uncharacterized protein n=2 Tax=Fusarium decemcellulare TaxID=57161 RepID=A0ACC1T0V8_9HYPO|nr:hypothetical protein NM208_g627 [Fusarium decemcellulare]KAJ3550259.1 hypothetical protein NM208_g70 [Fusarium decemcellulare]